MTSCAPAASAVGRRVNESLFCKSCCPVPPSRSLPLFLPRLMPTAVLQHANFQLTLHWNLSGSHAPFKHTAVIHSYLSSLECHQAHSETTGGADVVPFGDQAGQGSSHKSPVLNTSPLQGAPGHSQQPLVRSRALESRGDQQREKFKKKTVTLPSLNGQRSTPLGTFRVPYCPAWPQQAPGQQASTHNQPCAHPGERGFSLNHNRIKDNLRSSTSSFNAEKVHCNSHHLLCVSSPAPGRQATICTPAMRTESN
ncbi:unnamed protein product [Leuciscus chuanchicus]